MPHSDPIAFFITISTYGIWLPGAARGWVEYKKSWKLPDPARELEAKAKMNEVACILTNQERAIVENQLQEMCQYRGWMLHPKNCRTNHLHVLIDAQVVTPKKVRCDI